MIKAVIFDCFGVLAEDGWLPFKRKYLAHDPELTDAVRYLGKQVDMGSRTNDVFLQETARLTGVPVDEVRRALSRRVPNEALFAYIAQALKPRYKIGLLSNASYDVLSELFTPEQAALFDASVLSYEVGLTKPDPRMFALAAERLGVSLNDCLLIDDVERYAVAAEEAGMRSLVYTDFAQFRHAIAPLLNSQGS